MKEFEIINLLKEKTKNLGQNDDLKIGIGDDTALLSNKFGNILITQDSISEGKHFRLDFSNGKNIANKLFNSNISDIASMGGKSKFALITAGLTSEFNQTHLSDFIEQTAKICKENDIALIGGDTVASNSGSSYFTMTLLGVPIDAKKILTRYSANVDDIICTTGYTGISGFGLKLLLDDNSDKTKQNEAVKNHLNAKNRSDIINTIMKFNISAMTDISDGLLANTKMLARKENGIEITNIPKSTIITCSEEEAQKLILTGGEDFELVFATSPEEYEDLKKELPEIFKIGKIIKENKTIVLGKTIDNNFGGFEHSF